LTLGRLALSSMKRRPGKAALAVLGLSVAVGAFVLVASLVLSMRATVDDRLTRYGSNLIVVPDSPHLSVSYGGLSVGDAGSGEVEVFQEDRLGILREMEEEGRLTAFVPVLLEPVEVGERTFLATGTEFQTAARVKVWWEWEGSLPGGPGAPSEEDGVLLGINVRNELGTDVGETLTIENQSFRVAGVLRETGDQEDNLIVMDRVRLASMTGRQGEVNLVEVTAAESSDIEGLVADIEEAIPGARASSVQKSLEFTEMANSSLEKFGLAVTGLVVIVAGLVVGITLLTAVRERRREIGVFRAVGYRQKDIARLVFTEVLVLSGISSFLGVALGTVGTLLAPRLAGDLALGAVFSPQVLAGGVGLSFLVGLAASVYPVREAVQMDPILALKEI